MQKITRPPVSLDAPPCSAFSWEELDWNANGEFWVTTDADPHGKLYLVTPDGQMIDVGCHADPDTDVNRACWMADALNFFRALAKTQNASSNAESRAGQPPAHHEITLLPAARLSRFSDIVRPVGYS